MMVGLFVLRLLWLIGNAVDRRKPLRKEPPVNGPIVFPFCSMTIAADVKYLGQRIACPSCDGRSTAPGGNAGTVQGLNLVGGIALIAVARGCWRE